MEGDEILLAVDPSLRGTGFAVLQRVAGKVRCLHFDVIKNSPKLPVPGCLLEIHTRLTDAISRFQPTAMAVESVIYVQSFPTAITLGSARGAVLLAAAQRGLPIHEYAPRRVKQAVVGTGAVGSTFAFSLLLGGLAAEIVLVDANARKAEGEAMDLMHAVPFARTTRIWAGTIADCAGGADGASGLGPGLPRPGARQCAAGRCV